MIVKDEPKIIKLNAVLIAQNADESEMLFSVCHKYKYFHEIKRQFKRSIT